MEEFTIHSSWGDIELDLDTAKDRAYLEAVSAPASVSGPRVRKLVNSFSPNTVAGLHLFTRLASAGKLDNPVDVGIVVGKISPISYSGLRTAIELKKRGVIDDQKFAEVASRFDVDEFLALDPDSIEEVEKSEFVAPLVSSGLLNGDNIGDLVSKIDVHDFDNVEILLALKKEGVLSDELLEQISDKFEVTDFDLTDNNQIAVLDSLYELGAFSPRHVEAVKGIDPNTISTDFLIHQLTGSDLALDR